MNAITKMTAEEVERWLDENATVKKDPNQTSWDSLDSLEYRAWDGVRVAGEDQYGRKRYEDVSGNGFFPKRGKKGTS